MTLRAEIVDLVRLNLAQQVGQRGAITQVTVMQKQTRARGVRIRVEMVDPRGVEAG